MLSCLKITADELEMLYCIKEVKADRLDSVVCAKLEDWMKIEGGFRAMARKSVASSPGVSFLRPLSKKSRPETRLENRVMNLNLGKAHMPCNLFAKTLKYQDTYATTQIRMYLRTRTYIRHTNVMGLISKTL